MKTLRNNKALKILAAGVAAIMISAAAATALSSAKIFADELPACRCIQDDDATFTINPDGKSGTLTISRNALSRGEFNLYEIAGTDMIPIFKDFGASDNCFIMGGTNLENTYIEVVCLTGDSFIRFNFVDCESFGFAHPECRDFTGWMAHYPADADHITIEWSVR